MYEFSELEDLARSAKGLANMMNVFITALFDNKSGKPKCEDAMSLYCELLDKFADGLQDYFDRAYEDWKEKGAA